LYSRRASWNLSPNRLAVLLEEKKRRGVEVLDLTESNPTAAGLAYPAAALREAISLEDALVYRPDPRGLRAAREAVAARMGVEVDRVMLTASTSEAYGWLFKLLCDPGDEVLAPVPSYPLCEYLATLESVSVRPYPLRWDGSWHIDRGALEAAVGPRTRAVLVVHPGNPTGAFLKKGELAMLDDLCVRHGLALVSDEVFREYGARPDPRRAGMVAAETVAPSFSMSGLSKQAGLPQLKLGWIVVGGAPERRGETLERLETIADTYLSVATPVQVGLELLLALGDGVRQQILDRVTEGRARLTSICAAAPAIDVLPSEGGWYAILQLPRIRSDQEWALALLEEHDVLVQPGYFFDFASEGLLVVSLLTRPEVLEEGAKRLVRSVGG
jgi:alanine-synthesizing transaminase